MSGSVFWFLILFLGTLTSDLQSAGKSLLFLFQSHSSILLRKLKTDRRTLTGVFQDTDEGEPRKGSVNPRGVTVQLTLDMVSYGFIDDLIYSTNLD